MNKTIYLPNKHDKYADGIRVSFDGVKTLDIYGSFDNGFLLPGGELTLAEFFNQLGITEKDCREAFEGGSDDDKKN